MSSFANDQRLFNPIPGVERFDTADQPSAPLPSALSSALDRIAGEDRRDGQYLDPIDLNDWEDTDPETWPAEWADVPIPFRLAESPAKGVAIGNIPRGLGRRGFLGLTAGAASGSILGRRPAWADEAPGPLARAYRAVLDASAECRRLSPARPDDGTAPAFERRLGDAIRREADAERRLVALIARSAGFRLGRPDDEADLFTAEQHRPVAIATEGGRAYLLVVASAGSIGCPNPDPGATPTEFWFRPVVVDLGGLA